MSVNPEPIRPGRKRSEDSRTAILTAALELVAEVGYAKLTVEGIAARSGAGKQTIYRWWPSKADVLFDAMATKADLHVPVADQGSYEADLRAFLGATFRMGGNPAVVEVLRVLMANAQLDPEFFERFRAMFLQRRRDALGEIVSRARERGDLPGISGGTAADIVFGVVWYRMLATRQPLAEAEAEELLKVLTKG